MEIILKLFYGGLLFTAGFFMIKYRNKTHNFVGNWYWAERALGSGGTIFVLTMIAIGLMFFGVLYPFGGINLLIGP